MRMDIRGEKCFLTVSEQFSSGLESPIDITTCNAVGGMSAAMEAIARLEPLMTTDDEEGLPKERAASILEYSRAFARKSVFSAIVGEQVLRGHVEVDAVISLLR